jgi:hypothetical protein
MYLLLFISVLCVAVANGQQCTGIYSDCPSCVEEYCVWCPQENQCFSAGTSPCGSNIQPCPCDVYGDCANCVTSACIWCDEDVQCVSNALFCSSTNADIDYCASGSDEFGFNLPYIILSVIGSLAFIVAVVVLFIMRRRIRQRLFYGGGGSYTVTTTAYTPVQQNVYPSPYGSVNPPSAPPPSAVLYANK